MWERENSANLADNLSSCQQILTKFFEGEMSHNKPFQFCADPDHDFKSRNYLMEFLPLQDTAGCPAPLIMNTMLRGELPWWRFALLSAVVFYAKYALKI